MDYDFEFEKNVREYAIKGIVKLYKLDYITASKLVEESESLKYSLRMAPDMIATYSEEQLADLIMDYIDSK